MNRVHIQTCQQKDLPELKQWLSCHENRAVPHGKANLNVMQQDGCLLLARSAHDKHGKIRGVAGLELKSCRIQVLALDRAEALPGLLTAVERLAVSFGILSLWLKLCPSRKQALALPGYQADTHSGDLLQRNLIRRLTAHARKALHLNRQLGVPADYGRQHRLRLQAEPVQLASIGQDVFDREQFMTPQAAKAFHRLVNHAAAEDIAIQPVSAFRSVDYQSALVQNKLDQGQSMEDILRVSAAPGFSEHHSGRAVDLTTPDFEVLEETFADSAAFRWLARNAAASGFRMSYPEGNRHGVAYEPWHWYYSG